MKNTNKILTGVLASFMSLIIFCFIFRVEGGETLQDCERLMQEYHVESLEELINYGH